MTDKQTDPLAADRVETTPDEEPIVRGYHDLRDKLISPFPSEAMSTYNSGGFKLTSIKAQYVIERLNEVFGYGRWRYQIINTVKIDNEIISKISLYPPNGHPITQFGGKRRLGNSSWTDAYKSSVTDGLTKCASIAGIGNDVFKGRSDGGES